MDPKLPRGSGMSLVQGLGTHYCGVPRDAKPSLPRVWWLGRSPRLRIARATRAPARRFWGPLVPQTDVSRLSWRQAQRTPKCHVGVCRAVRAEHLRVRLFRHVEWSLWPLQWQILANPPRAEDLATQSASPRRCAVRVCRFVCRAAPLMLFLGDLRRRLPTGESTEVLRATLRNSPRLPHLLVGRITAAFDVPHASVECRLGDFRSFWLARRVSVWAACC